MGNATLSYDADGNTITDNQGNTDTYNAWNMLMSVKSGNTTISAFTYDGLGHRITESPDAEVSCGPATDLYYSSQWQVLQENQTITSGNTTTLQLQTRYVWSPVYVNAMVLRDYDFTFSGATFTITDRFRAEQQANATPPAPGAPAPDLTKIPPPGSSILDTIKIDPAPYDNAAELLIKEDYPNLARRGNYALLADKPSDAKDYFERGYAVVPQKWLTESVENIARAIRAQNRNVAPANAWIMSLQSKAVTPADATQAPTKAPADPNMP